MNVPSLSTVWLVLCKTTITNQTLVDREGSSLLSASHFTRVSTREGLVWTRINWTTNHSDRCLEAFPLFKRCEWLVFNRFVSKRRPPLYPHHCDHRSSFVNGSNHRDIRIKNRRGRNLRYRAREREVAIRAPVVSLAR